MNTSDLIKKTCEELDRAMVSTYISPGIVWGKTVNLTIGEFISGGNSLNIDEYREAVIEHCKYLLHKYRIRWWECFSNNQRKRDINELGKTVFFIEANELPGFFHFNLFWKPVSHFGVAI